MWSMRTVWILGDQLHEEHPALARADRRQDRVLFIESRQSSEEVRYHQIRLVLIFSAMRHRAAALRKEGWKVDYVELADDFTGALRAHVQSHQPSALLMQEPSQYAFRQRLPHLARELGIPIQTLPTNQFLLAEAEFRDWAGDHPHLRMENHYRRMRLKLDILIERNGQPTGGAWNYDADNRQTANAFARSRLRVPVRAQATPDALTQKVIATVQGEFPTHPGNAADFWLPVTRTGAVAWLRDFITHRLEHFGPWEDMMLAGEPTLFHSVLTPLLNIGLLTPRECVDAAVAAFHDGGAPLASVEGFVRQIIGWREFVNGVYWHRMPGYEELNALAARRPLPPWIYTGETEMNCLREVIGQVVRTGYNHHIQRLMVLGNFFLLGGFSPAAVLRWYLEMYVDAHDWVMAANVIGMVLHADGGYMATKPYAAGAGYIHKMSNYCAGCRYRPEARTGPDACPFNYLYWNFYATHEKRFATNARVGMMLKTWNKKTASEKVQVRREATAFLDALTA